MCIRDRRFTAHHLGYEPLLCLNELPRISVKCPFRHIAVDEHFFVGVSLPDGPALPQMCIRDRVQRAFNAAVQRLGKVAGLPQHIQAFGRFQLSVLLYDAGKVRLLHRNAVPLSLIHI